MKGSDADDDPGVSDPDLRAMRAVWLSMRDEDPPDRGMAALMAAARAQVAKPPGESWWQRVLSTLRRPPVLALASVAILASGAVLVARSGGAKLAEPDVQVRAEREKTTMRFDEGSAGQGGAANGEAPAAPGSGVLGSVNAAGSSDGGRRPSGATTVEAPGSMRGAKADRTGAPREETRNDVPADRSNYGRGPAKPVTAGKPANTESADLDRADEGGTAKLSEAGGAVATKSPPPAKYASPPEPKVEVRAPDTTASIASDSAPPKAPGASQLVQQCESAAARGDCAAVKILVEKIGKLDAGYRARAPKAVADCL